MASSRQLPWALLLVLCLGIASADAQRCKTERRLARIKVEDGSPRDSGTWMREHKAWARDASKRKRDLEIVMFGDSITEDISQKGILEDYYQPNFNTGAYGIGGDRAYHIKWRVQQSFVDGLKPELVSILAGINDIRGLANDDGLDDEDEVEEVANRVIADIKQMASFIHQKSPCTKILLQAILPTAMEIDGDEIKNEWPNKFTPVINKVNRGLRAFARRRQMVYYTDECSNVFLSRNSDRRKPRYSIIEDRMDDFLHPTTEGHKEMAMCMLKKMVEIIDGVAEKTETSSSEATPPEKKQVSSERSSPSRKPKGAKQTPIQKKVRKGFCSFNGKCPLPKALVNKPVPQGYCHQIRKNCETRCSGKYCLYPSPTATS